jgi:TPR repeat protein
MMLKTGHVGAILFLASTTFAFADTATGLKALENHDYATAVREFNAGVDRGEADAQVNLGIMYARGLGVEKDIAEAWRLFQLSAAQGNAQAQFRMGLRSAQGWGVQQDFAQASKWYQRAADQGDTLAEQNIASLYEDGFGVEQNYKTAVHYYRGALLQPGRGQRVCAGAVQSCGTDRKRQGREAGSG